MNKLAIPKPRKRLQLHKESSTKSSGVLQIFYTCLYCFTVHMLVCMLFPRVILEKCGYAVSVESSYSHCLNACLYMTRNYFIIMHPRCRSSPIEHASSMHWHTSVLMQSLMHSAMESTSSAYTCAILNVIHHRRLMDTLADMRAILNTCQVV